MPATVVTAMSGPPTPGWPSPAITGSSQVATALKTPTPTSSSPPAARAAAPRAATAGRARAVGDRRDDGHPEHRGGTAPRRPPPDRVGREQPAEPAGRDEGCPAERPQQDADELRGAADGDGHVRSRAGKQRAATVVVAVSTSGWATEASSCPASCHP